MVINKPHFSCNENCYLFRNFVSIKHQWFGELSNHSLSLL